MKLVLENSRGEKLDLLNNRDKFVLMSAEALHGIETDISESDSPYIDGSFIENVKALARGIELTFAITGDVKESINYFTSFVKSKQYITLNETEDDKNIFIKGIATIPPYSRMSELCKINLSVFCGDPYWEDVQKIVGAISSSFDLLYFPSEGQYFTANGRPFGVIDTSLEKTIVNDGDTTCGMIIRINARGEVKNPRIGCSTGDQNGWYMQFNITLNQNDELIVNTTKGQKSITLNGTDKYEDKPILDYLEFKGKDWLQLETGENTFKVIASAGADLVGYYIEYRRKYE